MTATHPAASAVLVAIDISKHRHEVLIGIPGKTRRRRMTIANTLEDFQRLNAELHSLIYAATRNELLISLNDMLGDIRNRAPWIRLKKKVITEATTRHLTIIIEDLFPG